MDSLLEKVKDHVDHAGLTEEGFRRLYSVNANFNPEEHHKKLETYLKINDNTKAARITVRGRHTRRHILASEHACSYSSAMYRSVCAGIVLSSSRDDAHKR